MTLMKFRALIAGAAALMTLLAVPALAGQEEAESSAAIPARGLRARVRADLGLTAEQEKALRGLREARQTESRAFRDEMARIRGEMRELAKDPEANRAKLEALIDRRAALRSGREKTVLRSRAERARILTPEQRKRIEAIRSGIGGRHRAFARGEAGFRGPGRFARPGFAPGRLARLRALRHRPFLWRRL